MLSNVKVLAEMLERIKISGVGQHLLDSFRKVLQEKDKLVLQFAAYKQSLQRMHF